MVIVRYISFILILTFFITSQKTVASELLVSKNNITKDNFKIEKNVEFKCFKFSRKYIAGQKKLVLGVGNLKLNFLNFDGFRKISQYKCLMK